MTSGYEDDLAVAGPFSKLEPTAKRLPWPAYEHFFSLINSLTRKKGNFEVKCKLCLNTKISMTKNSTFKKLHILR